MNMVTHIVGGGLSIIGFLLSLIKVIQNNSIPGIIGICIYGVSLITLYAMSSIYHGLRIGTGKKVLQILDHCAIYFLIAGTYTPILLSGIMPVYPVISWVLLILQWCAVATATTLTAIDLKKYKLLSMLCYIIMGWSIIIFAPQAYAALGHNGFMLILWGGIAYSIGAVLFAVGSKLHWFHSIFHIFVLIGSILHFLGIYLFVI